MILIIHTRTPLHIGAGASVGAIDLPVQRERHTGFPLIPATSLKGSFADHWEANFENQKGEKQRLSTKEEGTGNEKKTVVDGAGELAWLFGSDTTDLSFAGSLLFSEARLLAFPIRSAKGSFAWITCPLMLQRAAHDGIISAEIPEEPKDTEAIFAAHGPLALKNQIVLEEYTFQHKDNTSEKLSAELAALTDDPLLETIKERLVILSNGMMSHFATTTCEVAQHVRINDQTGTAEEGGLYNQENVPADTLLYSILNATKSRVPGTQYKTKTADEALAAFRAKVDEKKTFQFGANATTGLGYCSVTARAPEGKGE